MKKIDTKDAIGSVLCHDMTQIIVGESKKARFKRGHVVTKEDIDILLSMGKEHVYVVDGNDDGLIHEEEAAEFLYNLCVGKGIYKGDLKEGRINGMAQYDGLLSIDDEALFSLNMIKDICVSTKPDGKLVKKGENVIGARVVPLYVEQTLLDNAKQAVDEIKSMSNEKYNKIISVHEIINKKVGLVVTGSEVYKGLVKDGFTPVLEKKLSEYGAYIVYRTVVDDDDKNTTRTILDYLDKDVDIILCTGGMSIDPDDKTPLAIKNTGAEIISYGSPVLPGAMFLIAYFYKGDKCIPILGLPGAVMYFEKTVFDYYLPYVLCGKKITKEYIARLGNGGLLDGKKI